MVLKSICGAQIIWKIIDLKITDIHLVQTSQVFYTSYDVEWQSDTININTQCNIMVAAPPLDESNNDPECEKFWYAQVLGIYHSKVATSHPQAPHKSKKARNMFFLWVCWYGDDPSCRYGFHRAHLPKIGFVPSTDNFAFGFLDPALVIRTCHLIPTFSDGRTTELLPHSSSIARQTTQAIDDWMYFYVNV